MSNRFDDLARALASGASRREALRTLAAGAGAALLGWLGAGRAAAGDEDDDLFGGDCRPDGTPCRFRRQCCSRNCVDAQCKCRNEGIPCRSSAQCCSRLCEKGICRPTTCPAGGCPTAATGDCSCVDRVGGGEVCHCVVCCVGAPLCESDADCSSGQVCADTCDRICVTPCPSSGLCAPTPKKCP